MGGNIEGKGPLINARLDLDLTGSRRGRRGETETKSTILTGERLDGSRPI